MTTTKYLQLPIPSKSDRGKIITECLDPAFTKIDQKIESIDENIDFNLLATLGIPYGGILNNNNQKVAGTAYYDNANKKIYKCTANTSINYADAGYFIEVSNNDLLGKLQNLNAFIKTHVFTDGLNTLKINEYESFYYYEFQGDNIAPGQTLRMSLGGLSIKTPSVGYFNLPSASGNGNTIAQWTRCYSDSFRVLAGNNGLNPSTFSGGYIPKL